MCSNQSIDGLSLTSDWLEQTLTRHFNRPTARLVNIRVAGTSGTAIGYLSRILRIHCIWGPNSDALPASVILKTPTLANLVELWQGIDHDMADRVKKKQDVVLRPHNAECAVYQLFLNQSAESLGARLHAALPVVFDTKRLDSMRDSGAILMEDLSDRGVVPDIIDGLSIGQLNSIAEALADLHAYSLRTDEWRRVAKLEVDFLFLDDIAERAFFSGLDRLEQQAPDLAHNLHRIRTEVVRSIEDIRHVFSLHDRLLMRSVLVHGDLWSNNLMMNRIVDEQGNITAGDQVVAIFDWQLAHASTPGEDWARLLGGCVSPEILTSHLDALFDRYYSRLCHQLSDGATPPFSGEHGTTSPSSGEHGATPPFSGGDGATQPFSGEHGATPPFSGEHGATPPFSGKHGATPPFSGQHGTTPPFSRKHGTTTPLFTRAQLVESYERSAVLGYFGGLLCLCAFKDEASVQDAAHAARTDALMRRVRFMVKDMLRLHDKYSKRDADERAEN